MEQVLSAGLQHVHVKAELPDDDDEEPSIVATAGATATTDYMDFHQIFGGRPDSTMRADELPEQMIAHLSHAYPELIVQQSFAHRHSQPFQSYSSSASSASSASSKSDPSAVGHSDQPSDNNTTADPIVYVQPGGGGGDAESDKKKRFACPECGKLFGRVSHVRRHQLLHTGNKPFGCSVCGDRFTRVENRDRHMIMHTEQRPYNCEQCGKGFTQLNRLKVHQLTHTGERPFECEACAKRFLRVDHLRVHMRTHREVAATTTTAATATEMTAVGVECGAVEVTVTEGEMEPKPGQKDKILAQDPFVDQPHVSSPSLHTAANPTVAADPPAIAAQCSSPSEMRASPAAAAAPIVDGAPPDKPFQCGECPKQFARRDHYARHVAVHSGERPFSCDLCPKQFSRKDNKYSHMVGCLLKNYSVQIDCGGGAELPRGQLQRTVDERVRDVLGDAYVEPETQLEEVEEEEERRPCDGNENDDVDLEERDERRYGEPRDGEQTVAIETPPLSSTPPSAAEAAAAPITTVCLLKVRSIDEMAACRPPQQPDADQPSYVADIADTTDEEPTNYSTSAAVAAVVPSLPSPPRRAPAFRCDVCDKPFHNKSHLVRHAALHTSDRPFRCDQCDKAFNRKEHLQRHVIVHTGIKPFRCAFCARSFVEQNQQRRHVHEEHADEAAAAVAAEEDAFDGAGSGCVMMDSGEARAAADGLYHCDRCDRAYAVRFRLRRHYAQHTGERPFQCDYCEQRFSRAEHKRRHMAVHTNEKRFECEFCERRFVRADHMLAHVKTHEGVLPYKCTVCAHRFATAKQKMEHMRRHTGAYRCEMCLERFESFGELSEHRRDIHLQAERQQADEADGADGEEAALVLVGRSERYPCPVCKRRFGIGRLGDHLRLHVAPRVDDGRSDDERREEEEEERGYGGGGRVYADGMAVDLGRPMGMRYADDERCAKEEGVAPWTAMKVECCDGDGEEPF